MTPVVAKNVALQCYEFFLVRGTELIASTLQNTLQSLTEKELLNMFNMDFIQSSMKREDLRLKRQSSSIAENLKAFITTAQYFNQVQCLKKLNPIQIERVLAKDLPKTDKYDDDISEKLANGERASLPLAYSSSHGSHQSSRRSTHKRTSDTGSGTRPIDWSQSSPQTHHTPRTDLSGPKTSRFAHPSSSSRTDLSSSHGKRGSNSPPTNNRHSTRYDEIEQQLYERRQFTKQSSQPQKEGRRPTPNNLTIEDLKERRHSVQLGTKPPQPHKTRLGARPASPSLEELSFQHSSILKNSAAAEKLSNNN